MDWGPAFFLSTSSRAKGEKRRSVPSAGASAGHFDVMDGHEVKNRTMEPSMCRFRPATAMCVRPGRPRCAAPESCEGERHWPRNASPLC
ncbi:MAG: hypothetical protein ACYS0G_05510 [Planctomycetota bacterium]